MKVEDFDYILPEELIAQHPLLNRDTSRLLVMDKVSGDITHDTFSSIIDYFDKDDVLVLNDTKVIPARLFGEKEDTKAYIEVLLLKQEDELWQTLCKPARRIKEGSIVSFGGGKLKAKCVRCEDEGIRYFEMIFDGIFLNILEELGQMPLPPYIHESLEDKNRYQTVYAKNPGSAAAPTAGLHFTNDVLKKIKDKGVTICYITLHVGLGTFRPVSVVDIKNHHMHSEYFEISKDVSDILNSAIKDNKRIISVGTTTTRTLEAAYDNGFRPSSGWTDIFIYPGYKFKVVNSLITNFHLPKSTLLMLVSALSSKENILNAYNEAIKEKYRFFSFGDSMFIKGDR